MRDTPNRWRTRARSIAAIALGAAVAVATALVPATADPAEPDVTVADRTAERNTFFPSVTRADNDDLVVVYYDSPVHQTNLDGRLSMVRSDDDGQTWSTPEVIIDTPVDDRDPSITKLSSGRLVVNFFRRDVPVSNIRHSYVSYSDDNGQTWSTPVEVGTAMSRSATSAPVVELSNGDLLLPLYGYVDESTAIHQVTVVRSTDGGVTWPAANETVAAYMPGGEPIGLNEPSIVDFGQGELAILMRSADDPDDRGYVVRSYDDGATWGVPERQTFSPHAPDILPITSGSGYLVTWGDYEPGETGRPVMGRLVEDGDFEQFGRHLIYENPGVFDMSYPSSVQIDSDTFLTVYYDSDRGFIGGTFTELSDYLQLDLLHMYEEGEVTVSADVYRDNLLGAIDGSIAYADNSGPGRDAPPDWTYTLTFAQARQIDDIGVVLKPGYAETATIEVSPDGTSWSQVGQLNAAQTDELVWLDLPGSQVADSIRVTVTDSHGEWAQLTELAVRG